MTNTPSTDLELMRAVALLDTDAVAAARLAGSILERSPDHPQAKLLFAAACRRVGDPAAAIGALEPLAATESRTPIVQMELGRAYAAAGRAADAAVAFGRAVDLDPALLDGWKGLAAARFVQGDEAGGDRAYAGYESRAADPPGFHNALAALAEGRLDAAAAFLGERLQRDPGDVIAMRLLAEVASRRNDLAQAERWLLECLRLGPGFARARFDLANVYFAMQRPENVMPLVERLLALDPAHPATRMLKARTIRLLGAPDEAVALLEQVVADFPRDDGAWLLLGHVQREVGAQGKAIEAYRRAIEQRPDSGEAYWSLANLKTVRLTPDDIAAIRQLLTRTSLSTADRTQLEFALGKALEDENVYAESFAHYARGNALQRQIQPHDPGSAADLVRRSKALFTPAFFRERAGWGSERADPIFIVGVPRSGSTLLEQMLASHSQVEGTRELSDLPIVASELGDGSAQPRTPYPEIVAGLARADLDAAAAKYLERTARHRSTDRPFFIDKLPSNFGHVGLIQLMFPKAAIIDARRHPLGCGLSCYKQLFVWGASFSNDLTELGTHIREYDALMAHYEAVLPGRIARVHYERLVADPRAGLGAVLDYCGLPMEEGCLRFYENRRVVQSVSSEQVRRPVYGEAVDQWRHYEEWLGPLKSALGDLLARYPVDAQPARGEGSDGT